MFPGSSGARRVRVNPPHYPHLHRFALGPSLSRNCGRGAYDRSARIVPLEIFMSRKLRAAVAQLGPIHLADDRKSVVQRLIALLREAHAGGAEFVVFPELALTTFFPRWWMTDQAEIDRFFEAQMPGPETQPLFELARELKVGFYLGYAELTEEAGQTRRYNTSILVERDGRIVGRYRKIHLPGHSEHLPNAPFQH